MNIPTRQLEECIARERATEPFSGVVSLRRGDAILFERAYGLALRAESIPNDVDTRFQIASGSKLFTSVAICQLIERGLLTPDTLLTDCLDISFPQFNPGVTVHHLLTHTSGLPDYFDEAVMNDYEALWQHFPMYKVRRPADFLPLFQDKPMRAASGETFAYNNASFILLGLIVEQLTQTSFTNYITEHIFQPCGMQHSGYFAADQLPGGTASAYIQNPDGTWRSNIYAVPIIGGPDGGAYATASDMARFWNAVLGHQLLGHQGATTLLVPQVTTQHEAPYTHYGYGVWIETVGESIKKIFIEGADPGVAFRSAVYPAEEMILTILGNTSRSLWPIYREIEDLLVSA